jgi:hypothetical protein
VRVAPPGTKVIEVFWFFFSKKNRFLSSIERLGEVCQNIVDMLDANREPDIAIRDAG